MKDSIEVKERWKEIMSALEYSRINELYMKLPIICRCRSKMYPVSIGFGSSQTEIIYQCPNCMNYIKVRKI